MSDAVFGINYMNKYSIDTTPEAEQPTWVELAPGVTEVTPSVADTVDTTPYMDGEGFNDNTVTGIDPTWAVSGHRKHGDPAQDYIASIAYEKGKARETHFKWEQFGGRTLTFNVTVTDISLAGGAANAKENFGATIRANGKPTADSAA